MLFGNYDLDKIVSKDHSLRKVATAVKFNHLATRFSKFLKTLGRRGYGLDVGIKCLFLQFYYDLSDREMEERLRHDMAFRWFCEFKIEDETPEHTYFSRVRTLLGAERAAKIFDLINEAARKAGIMRGTFTFVDSTVIKAKETTWAERDKALAEGAEALNNGNVADYAADKNARFGCKGKDKFWFGYKRHKATDMGSGLINKVAVTPANVSDAAGLKHICPDGGAVSADKAYCVAEAQRTMRARGCHSWAIRKNNMHGKNKDLDRWLTGVRMPFENVFSKDAVRARYRGLMKVQMQAFWEATVFNVKRLIVINAPPLLVGA